MDTSTKQFKFSYTNQKLLINLVVICMPIFVIGMLGGLFSYFSFIIAFGIPILIYLLNKRKLTKIGEATIDEDSVIFKLDDETKTVVFNDFLWYKVLNYDGSTILKLVTKSKEKLKITANDNFCDAFAFERFCDELQNCLESYKGLHPDSSIIRKKTIYERKWTLPMLIFMTLSVLFVLYYGYTKDRNSPVIYTSIGILIAMWFAYFRVLSKIRS